MTHLHQWASTLLAGLLAFGCFGVAAQAQPETLRVEVIKPLQQAQELNKQNKNTEALARFAEVDALPAGADLAAADASDSPVGIVLGFEGDRTRWSPRTGPTICSPTGSPAAVKPQGTEIAGWRVRLNGRGLLLASFLVALQEIIARASPGGM